MADASKDDRLELDLSGLLCPHVVLAAAAALRARPHLRRVAILSTDPLSVVDVPVFALRQGFEVVERVREGATIRFLLARRGPSAQDGDATP